MDSLRTEQRHRVVKKARRRKKASHQQEEAPSRRTHGHFGNRTESTDTLPRLSILGEGRFPSGAYDVIQNDVPGTSSSTQDTDNRAAESHRPSAVTSPQTSAPSSPPRPADHVSSQPSSSFLSSLLESQNRLFTPAKFLRVNTSDGSLFSVDGDEDDFWRSRRQIQVPTTSQTPDETEEENKDETSEVKNENEDENHVEEEAEADEEKAGASSQSHRVEDVQVEEEEAQPSLVYSPVVEVSQGFSDVESTPRTDISSSTAPSGLLLSPSARLVISGRNSTPADLSSNPGPSRRTEGERDGWLVRSKFDSRIRFEEAIAYVAKPVVSHWYHSKKLTKEEYKDQLRRILQKIRETNHKSLKISDIETFAKKCLNSYLRHRSRSRP